MTPLRAYKIFQQDFLKLEKLNINEIMQLAYAVNVVAWHHLQKNRKYKTELFSNYYYDIKKYVLESDIFTEKEKKLFRKEIENFVEPDCNDKKCEKCGSKI